MRSITLQQELAVLKYRFEMIFQSSDPFTAAFQSKIEERFILCPINGNGLTQEQFSALAETLCFIGEASFYISEIEVANPFEIFTPKKYQARHWECSAQESYNNYLNLLIPIENVVYSTSGSWGILFSHEGHALIGGTHFFTSTFKNNYPNWLKDKQTFIKLWESYHNQYNSDISWLAPLLKYIYFT